MQAFVLEKYSAPLREVDMPVPVAGPGEVLVRVAAAGVNHADERLRTGEFRQIFPYDLPLVMGSELAGEVVGVGAGVPGSKDGGFEVGDQVFGYAEVGRMGAYAEVVAVDAAHLAPAPTSVAASEAASLPVAWLTAWQALVDLGQVQPGQTVLVHGGTGGVGTIAIQLAKHLGATVATTVSAQNADLARGLGADVVVDYRTQDFAEVLSDVDLVLDSQGGDTLARSIDVVRPGGLVIGITGPPDPAFADQAGVNPFVKLAIRGLSATTRRRAAKRGVTYRFLFVQGDGEQLRRGAELVDAGVVRPLVGRTFPFGQTIEAVGAVLAGGPPGKVVVTHDESGEGGPLAETWATAPTRRVESGGESLVYRELGSGDGPPVVLLTHLGATLDEWDPRFVDGLAREHRVVAIGLPGVGGSSGRVGATVAGMAQAAIGAVESLGLGQVDLVGFSLGGFVAQQVALDRPDLVRRLVLAGTGPAGGEGIDRPTGAAYIYGDMARGALARTDAKELLFFERDEEGRGAATEYLARLRERVMDRDKPISVPAFRRQIEAIKAWGRAEPQDLSRITAPTFIANGDHDRMVPSALSEDMHRRIPGSTLVIYPRSGHGGVFQHGDEFVAAVLAHLA